MYHSEYLEIWNLTDGGCAKSEAVAIFNIVGRLYNAQSIESCSYSLNNSPSVPVYFNRTNQRDGRLCSLGDFNIDTIDCNQLGEHNELKFIIAFEGGAEHAECVSFDAEPFSSHCPFRLDLAKASAPEAVGQVVEGPWHIAEDEKGEKCLEVRPGDAGYDRIITFGHSSRSTGYEIRARLAVTAIAGAHNFGLVFKWNPHAKGDGTYLPRNWSSGLAYYCSYTDTPGIRIRFGVDVHKDDAGNKIGSYLLGNSSLNRLMLLWSKIRRKLRLASHDTELKLGAQYWFKMKVHPNEYALTVWEVGSREPEPQVTVTRPKERLAAGAVGILAYEVGARVYEYEVSDIQP
jgi:hypothetical protein